MTTQKLMNIRQYLIENNNEASKALNEYCNPFKEQMGLVSDDCRNSETYQNLKAIYGVTWKSLRQFNQATSKNKELQKAIRQQIHDRRIDKLSK